MGVLKNMKLMNSTSPRNLTSGAKSVGAISKGAKSDGASSRGVRSMGDMISWASKRSSRRMRRSIDTSLDFDDPFILERHQQRSKSNSPSNLRKQNQQQPKTPTKNEIDQLTSRVISYRTATASPRMTPITSNKEYSERGRRVIPTTVVASGMEVVSTPRSRSAEPSLRKNQTSIEEIVADLSSDESTLPRFRSRSMDIAMGRSSRRKARSMLDGIGKDSPLHSSSRRERRSSSRDRGRSVEKFKSCDSLTASLSQSKSSSAHDSLSSKSTISSKPSAEPLVDMNSCIRKHLEGATPYRLGSDMTFLADGMNLDTNTRCLLAAYDAKTLEDFYLMTDSDFSGLIRKANATKNSLPPLQIRKVRMLRQWIREVVQDNMYEMYAEHGESVRKQSTRLIPKDWKELYKNDLPHLKLQLRQQGDSFFEKLRTLGDMSSLKEMFSCGIGNYNASFY